MRKRADITVTGEVQGVFYRVWAKQHAQALGITGFARNDPDGSVRVTCEGEEESIQEFADHCWDGPELAEVTGVQVSWSEYEGNFADFSI